MTIEADEGVVGHAFLVSSTGVSEALVSQIAKLIKPGLIGRNPLDIGAIWQSLWKRSQMLDTQAIGAIDVALWDIAGEVANLPIHSILGTCRDRVPVLRFLLAAPTRRGLHGGGSALPRPELEGVPNPSQVCREGSALRHEKSGRRVRFSLPSLERFASLTPASDLSGSCIWGQGMRSLMKDGEKDLLLIASRPQSVRKSRIVHSSMEEGEQVLHAALGDVFLWMESGGPTQSRELLWLRNTARF